MISILSDFAKKEGRCLQSNHSLIQQLIKQFSIFFHYCCGFSLFLSKSTNAFHSASLYNVLQSPKVVLSSNRTWFVDCRGISGGGGTTSPAGRGPSPTPRSVCPPRAAAVSVVLYQCGCDMADEGIEYDLIIQDGPKKVNTVIITLHFE